MQLTVNGEIHAVPAGSTVGNLLVQLGLDDGPVAVERNRVIVPRAEHPTALLSEGDVVEIVHFVGGG